MIRLQNYVQFNTRVKDLKLGTSLSCLETLTLSITSSLSLSVLLNEGCFLELGCFLGITLK